MNRAVVGVVLALAGLLVILLGGPVLGATGSLIVGLVLLIAGGVVFIVADRGQNL